MDYKRIYDDLMQSRLILKEERVELRKRGEYFEAHHIIPHSMGGGGKRNGWKDLKHPNIIILTAREHYIAHTLLWLIHRNRKMAYSLHAMCSMKGNGRQTYIVSSRMYSDVKCYLNSVGFSLEHREKIRQANLGKKMSPEAKEKISKIHLGKKISPESIVKMLETTKVRRLLGIIKKRVTSPEAKAKIRMAKLGRKHSPEARAKMSKSQLGRKHSPETRAKMSRSRIGRKLSSESIEKMRRYLLGKELTPEAREKLRQANLGKKHSPERIAKRVETFKRNRLLKELKSTEDSFNKHFDGGQGE